MFQSRVYSWDIFSLKLKCHTILVAFGMLLAQIRNVIKKKMLKTSCLPSGHFWPIIHFVVITNPNVTKLNLISLAFLCYPENLWSEWNHIPKPRNIKKLKIFCMIPLVYPACHILQDNAQLCYSTQRRLRQIETGRYQQFSNQLLAVLEEFFLIHFLTIMLNLGMEMCQYY